MAKTMQASAATTEVVKLDSALTELRQGLDGQATGFASSGISPYVWWASKQSKNWDVIAKSCPIQDTISMVLVDGTNYTLLDPFRFFLVSSKFFNVEADGGGMALKCFPSRRQVGTWPDGKPKMTNEWFEAVVIILLKDKAAIARCSFRGVKSPACKAACDEIEKSKTPEWLNQGSDYRLAGKIPVPDFRVVTSVSIQIRQPRDTSRGQKPYGLSIPTCYPVQAADMAALQDLMKSPDYQEKMRQVKSDHQRHIAELDRLMQAE